MILHKQMMIRGCKQKISLNAQPEEESEEESEEEPEEEPEAEPVATTKTELVIEPWPDIEAKPGDWITTLLEERAKPEMSVLSFEQLIEKGFEAKEREEHQKAADYFYLALKTEPAPDIAYYLITDSYGLWKSADLVDDALSKLVPFINKFQNEAPIAWQNRLAKWLIENEIHLYNQKRKE